MNIDAVENGIVIDHIEAGKSLEIYNQLGLQELTNQVAMIQNCPSHKMGRKDIIKISNAEDLDLDLDVLGYISPSITLTYIRNGKPAEKRSIPIPEVLTDVIVCKNPRCISSIEQELPQVFYLTQKDEGIYSCKYCDTQVQTFHKHK